MEARFLQNNLLMRALVFVLIATFVVTSLPGVAFCATGPAIDNLRRPATKGSATETNIKSYFTTNTDGQAEAIDSLVREIVLTTDNQAKIALNAKVHQMAKYNGIYTASIQDLYMARGRGEVKGFTVPAINIRGLTYDLAREVFRRAKKLDSGAIIFEIAKSEVGYTSQRPAEYAAVVLAAAIKEGWRGPVFIQGDHYQVSAKNYQANPQEEINKLKALVKESIEAGFFNIDIDASTLVDLSKPTLEEQQLLNAKVTAEMTAFIRSIEPKGITVSVGGEIGEVGKENTKPEELDAFMKVYKQNLAAGLVGISKISVQTGTHHGGVVLPDGTIAQVKVDFETLGKLSKIAREKYGLAGAVQHGASTLPPGAFDKFHQVEAAEVHLATGFQNIIYDSKMLPAELKAQIYAWIDKNLTNERKKEQTNEQFYAATRKKGFGAFKEAFMNLPEATRNGIANEVGELFELIFKKFNALNNRQLVSQQIPAARMMRVKRIGALTGGGPGSGLNATLAAAAKKARERGVELVFIYEGWKGLLDDALVNKSLTQTLSMRYIEAQSVKGGTMLGTSRTNPYSDDGIKKGLPAKLWENIQKLNLDGIIVLGGDDTNSVARQLQIDHPYFPVVGLPKTMDNDIALPDKAQTFGFDSFVKAATPAVRNGIIDAMATKRVLVVEVFGRSAGFVAARIGANVGASRTLIPEEDVDLEQLINDLIRYHKQNKYAVVIVSEGVKIRRNYKNNAKILDAAFKDNALAKQAYESAERKVPDAFGNPKLENAGLIINAILTAGFKEAKIKTSLAGKVDYLFRSAYTSELDTLMCDLLGQAAVETIVTGNKDQILYVSNNEVKSMPLTEKEKLGGRQFDYSGEDREEYLQANLALTQETKQEGILDTPALVKSIQSSDNTIFTHFSPGYESFVNSLKNLQEAKAALVIGANTIFENAGSRTALAKVRENQPGVKIAVWADNEVAVDKLKVMGVDKIADIISAKGLNDVLSEIAKAGIAKTRIVLINSGQDLENIKVELKVELTEFLNKNPEYKAITVKTPTVKGVSLNTMPVIFARALASIFQNETIVMERYKDLLQDYSDVNKISEKEMEALNDLTSQLAEIPLMKVSAEIAKAQITYEETVDKI